MGREDSSLWEVYGNVKGCKGLGSVGVCCGCVGRGSLDKRNVVGECSMNVVVGRKRRVWRLQFRGGGHVGKLERY